MSVHWIRTPPTRAENAASALVAGVLAGAVGVATFYVVRTLLARESLDRPALPPQRSTERSGGDT